MAETAGIHPRGGQPSETQAVQPPVHRVQQSQDHAEKQFHQAEDRIRIRWLLHSVRAIF